MSDDGGLGAAQGEDPAAIEAREKWLRETFPDIFPSVPSIEDRVVDLTIKNPFAEGAVIRHPTLNSENKLPTNGAVDGYIKFRFSVSYLEDRTSAQTRQAAFLKKELQKAPRPLPRMPGVTDKILSLPPSFGLGVKLDRMDRNILTFCELT